MNIRKMTEENERKERQCSAAFRQAVQSLFQVLRRAFFYLAFAQGHSVPLRKHVYLTKSAAELQA